uniref:Uncharacterized protein n=1 Tax=Capra hircus TaxID=9925 RepID=A0A8C2PC61_CAPHI
MASKLSLPRATLEPGKLPFVSLVSGIRAGPAPESGPSGGNRERVPGVGAEGPEPPPFVRRCCRPPALPPRHGLGRLGRPVAAAPAPRPHRSPLQRPGAQVQATTQHRLHHARPVAAPRPGLHLRRAPPGTADIVQPRARPPGARSHDRARPRQRPRVLHLRPPEARGALPHSRTGQVLPGASRERGVPQRASAHHRSPKLGPPPGVTNPRPRDLHYALAPGPARSRQSLGAELLHLRPQCGGQLLRGPQQDTRALRLPRGEPWGLQAPGPPVLDAAADFVPSRQHLESRPCSLQRGPALEASRLDLRDPALGLLGPDADRGGR